MAEDADRLVARAIESVLDQVPGVHDTSVPEGGSAKLQPWAETAAPAGRNKRPLEELLVELEELVAADPLARATLPRTRHPALAFFDRFGRGGAGQGGAEGIASEGGSRRRRRRRGGAVAGQLEAEQASPAASASSERPPGSRRRSRRGRGVTAGSPETPGTTGGGVAAPRQGNATGDGQPRAPGSGGRRRRGRRGRSGGRPSTG